MASQEPQAPRQTFGSLLDKGGGRGRGFDCLRVALSILIFLAHSILLAEGEHYRFDHPPLKLLHSALVPAFFAVSGFLVAGSASRTPVAHFLLLRAKRIVPALLIEVLFSSLLIGPIFTTDALTKYLASDSLRLYSLNIVGLVHFKLPGVFEQNPVPNTVNGSLWTIPYEIGCYAIMATFIVSGMLRRPKFLLAIVVVVYVCASLTALAWTNESWDAYFLSHGGRVVEWMANNYFQPSRLSLYICFLVGVVFYLFRYMVPCNYTCVLSVFAFLSGESFRVSAHHHEIDMMVLYMPIAYLVLALGTLVLPNCRKLLPGDYSYGIYLYGFPIQQSIQALARAPTSPWLNLALAFPLTCVFAALSWHMVERPILRRSVAAPLPASTRLSDSISPVLGRESIWKRILLTRVNKA